MDETLNSDPCFRQCESSPRWDAKPIRRSRGSVRLDREDEAEDEDEADDEADEPDPDDADDDDAEGCEARVDCASARGDDRRLLTVGTSTAASVMASDTRLTTRRWRGDPRRPIVSSVGR